MRLQTFLHALLAACETFKPQNESLSDAEFSEAWMAHRAEVVAGLN